MFYFYYPLIYSFPWTSTWTNHAILNQVRDQKLEICSEWDEIPIWVVIWGGCNLIPLAAKDVARARAVEAWKALGPWLFGCFLQSEMTCPKCLHYLQNFNFFFIDLHNVGTPCMWSIAPVSQTGFLIFSFVSNEGCFMWSRSDQRI